MQNDSYAFLRELIPDSEVENWENTKIPLQQRGVNLQWLIRFVANLQKELNQPRYEAIQEAKRAQAHNKAGRWGMHNQPDLPIPSIPKPMFINVHSFVKNIIKPLTREKQIPFYALIPEQFLGPPTTFISHTWNSVLVGPDTQRIGTLDTLERGRSDQESEYIWIDFVCYNQHTYEVISMDMETVIGDIGNVSFVTTLVPLLNRSWCLWELYCAEKARAQVDLRVRPGYRNDKIQAVNALYRSFSGIEKARSSSVQDQQEILGHFIAGFGTIEKTNIFINEMIEEKFSDSWFELQDKNEPLKFSPVPWISEQIGNRKDSKPAKRPVSYSPYFVPEFLDALVFGSAKTIRELFVEVGVNVTSIDEMQIVIKKTPQISELFQAIITESETKVCKLLEKGIDPNVKFKDISLLTWATQTGQVRIVRTLLKAGAEVNGAGGNIKPLPLAVDKGYEVVVRILIEYGADIDSANPGGWNALLYAARSGHQEILKVLIDNGANINIIGMKSETPLHLASQNGHSSVVRLLLEHGANVNCVTSHGTAPLHFAAEKGDPKVVQLLLEYGAEVNLLTKQGYSALTLAKMCDHQSVVEILQEKFNH